MDSNFDNPPVTLKDIIRKIIRSRWWIFTSVIVILIGTIYVTYSTPPIYEATVSVMIEKTSKAQTIFNFAEEELIFPSNLKSLSSLALTKNFMISPSQVTAKWTHSV